MTCYYNPTNRLMKNLLPVCIALLAFISTCNAPVSSDETPDIAILIPKTGYTYASYDTIYIVAQFNPAVAAPPQWQYSVDNGKSWKELSFFSRRSATTPADEDPFAYSVHRWVPETDGLGNDTLYLRAHSYGKSAIADIVGPVYIE